MPEHHEGFEVTQGIDGERTWVMVPAHSGENRALALDEAEWFTGNRYEVAKPCWMIDHSCPTDCEHCERDFGEVCSEADERGEEPDYDGLDCWCHEFEGSALQEINEARDGATPAYHLEDADA